MFGKFSCFTVRFLFVNSIENQVARSWAELSHWRDPCQIYGVALSMSFSGPSHFPTPLPHSFSCSLMSYNKLKLIVLNLCSTIYSKKLTAASSTCAFCFLQ